MRKYFNILQFFDRPISHSLCLSCQSLNQRQTARYISSTFQRQKTSGSASTSQLDEFTPQPLSRPLGLPYPPEIGQNTGNDTRTLGQRTNDFINREKHMERRVQLSKEFSKPYFRDWVRMRHHKGKTFLSNSRNFRRDKALYFPNLFGRTLDRLSPMQNTTPVLQGKISVVSIFSSLWAERQTASFIGEKQNPRLHHILQESNGVAQEVAVNVEDNWLKALLVQSFMANLRRKLPEAKHRRYFLVTKGFTDHLREQIGVMNSKVGYVYLLDQACRIRWAGSSIAAPTEIESLNAGLKRLVEEHQQNSITT
ncbi:conserved hypothetical protein [Uncinocarpus reesii 1704]|uniref:Mitochondrial ATPase complex subunit ATP10 n=1 Tax=Uncinocarpus reesii (strain UAMH 1704) TaxID=336963 RepID=C4JQS8_UNCRE|nr:uncharacterized protein UREG_03410 [Uncinocarpus reesii 1704]EEP78564.1 conserved hypothetical protein [Uncinocarpus reesii 1704]